MRQVCPARRSRIRARHTLAAIAFVAAVVALGLHAWLAAGLPPVRSLESRRVRPTTQIVDRNGRLLYEILDPDAGKQYDLNRMDFPRACIEATVATEDSRFYLHPGVDLIAVSRAALQNYRAGGEVVSGGSTITQQLARNLLMSPDERYEQSLRRKLREAYLALRIELIYSKDEIIALYLNQTYFGNFAFGLEAAAQVFFAKPAAHLSTAECALLVGLIQYPTGYNPFDNPEGARLRQATVLRLMREAGFLSADELERLAAEPLRFRAQLFDIEAPHFVMLVQDLVKQRIGLERLQAGGLRIVTSLDLDLQRRAEDAVRYRLDLLNCRVHGACDATTDPDRRVDNAAAVVLDAHTGDILAMIGSPDYFNARIQGNVNGALALRQPGSAIKPFTYAAALDPEWSAMVGLPPLTPASILADLPATFYVTDDQGGNVPYQPVNYDLLVHGPVSVRTALANSYNIPAVKVLDRIGVETLRRIAAQSGISTFSGEYGLALTLGGGEVTLLDLSTAYGVFLQGRRLENRAILDIQKLSEDGSWQSLANVGTHDPVAKASSPSRGVQVVEPATAYLITNILSDPLARLPAFGARSVLELPFPAAVKTGTTTDWRDNWTVGYSTQRIVGVWVGNADNAPMRDVSGIDGAGPIWHDIMLASHAEPPPDFAVPAKIASVEICAPSGLLPSPHCSRLRQELFLHGTEPTRADDQFAAVAVDRATGYRADAETPPERVGERVYWMLPAEYHDWMVAQGIPRPPLARPPLDPGVDTPAGPQSVSEPAGDAPLVLVAPASHAAYQIHPGVPRARQRIDISGFAAGGEAWADLSIYKDGEVLVRAADASRIQTWWNLAPGTYRFWIEGKATTDSPAVQSNVALVVVEEYSSSLSGVAALR
jgi:penicillin-binding protein 1C